MRKFLSVNLVGLFVLSGSYASTEEHQSAYAPRTPATKAQISAAFDAAKKALGLTAPVCHPNHLNMSNTFEMAPKKSLSSQRVSSLSEASSSSGTLTRVSKSPSGNISHAFTTGIELAPEVSFFSSDLEKAVEDLLSKTGPRAQSVTFMVQPSSSSSDSDEDSWDDSDSEGSDEEGSDEDVPAPFAKRVSDEEARRMQRNAFLKESSDLDKKIAVLARKEEEKKKMNISQETMDHREAETKDFYLKSNSIPQFFNKDGRRLTKAVATPSFQRKHTADDAS